MVVNNQFHAVIYQAANRPRMSSIIEYVRSIATPYIRQLIEIREHLESSRDDHRRIFEACKKEDGRLAEIKVGKHLQDVAKPNVEVVESVDPEA